MAVVLPLANSFTLCKNRPVLKLIVRVFIGKNIVFRSHKKCFPNSRNKDSSLNSVACLVFVLSAFPALKKLDALHLTMITYSIAQLAIPELRRELGRVSSFNQSINWHRHMKDHVQSCHLTKFDAFGVNRNDVVDLETWLKSIQMSVFLRQLNWLLSLCGVRMLYWS